MSDQFTPQIRALLDRLEPPALSAGFADRIVAAAEAQTVLPPLPPLRKPGRRWRPRVVLAVAAVGLVGVAAAAAVVPAEAWRDIPVIGNIVELIDPAEDEPAPVPKPNSLVPTEPEATEPPVPETVSDAAPELVSDPEAGPPQVAQQAVAEPAPGNAPTPPTERSAPLERLREPAPEPVRDAPLAERSTPIAARDPAPTVAETRTDPAPERIRPADTSDTRQQIRERTTDTRQATRERRERTDRRISRLR